MDKTLRVVIDTNHIIPAILSKQGASAKLIDWYLQEDYFQLLISRHIWKEYSGVKIVPIRKLLKVLEKMEEARRNGDKKE